MDKSCLYVLSTDCPTEGADGGGYTVHTITALLTALFLTGVALLLY